MPPYPVAPIQKITQSPLINQLTPFQTKLASMTITVNNEPQPKKQKLNSPNSNINRLVNTVNTIEDNSKPEVSNSPLATAESNSGNTSQEERPVKANSIPPADHTGESSEEAIINEGTIKTTSVPPSMMASNVEAKKSGTHQTSSSENSIAKANDQNTAETMELSTATSPTEVSPLEGDVKEHSREENNTTGEGGASTSPIKEKESAAAEKTGPQQEELPDRTITVIKPTLETMETVKEEAKMREEEQTAQEKSPQESILPRENVVRQVEEDENYDD